MAAADGDTHETVTFIRMYDVQQDILIIWTRKISSIPQNHWIWVIEKFTWVGKMNKMTKMLSMILKVDLKALSFKFYCDAITVHSPWSMTKPLVQQLKMDSISILKNKSVINMRKSGKNSIYLRKIPKVTQIYEDEKTQFPLSNEIKL